jgi:hypothetical protein
MHPPIPSGFIAFAMTEAIVRPPFPFPLFSSIHENRNRSGQNHETECMLPPSLFFISSPPSTGINQVLQLCHVGRGGKGLQY